MPHTNLQIKLDYYKKVIEESKKSPYYEQYNAVCRELELLVQLSDTLNHPDRIMSETEFRQLNLSYRAVQNACRSYLRSDQLNKFEKDRVKIIKDISNVLEKDMDQLRRCDPKQPGSLADIISRARSHTIVINSKDIKAMGAVLSSRIPLKTPSGKKGFFTADVAYDPDAKWNENVDKCMNAIGNKYPESRKYLEKLKTDREFQMEFRDVCPPATIEEYIAFGMEYAVDDKLAGVAVAIGISDSEEDAKNIIDGSDLLRKALIDFIRDMVPVISQIGIMEEAGIKKGTTISGRNCAMTDMAKLLGCEGLLANSSHMTVMIDGRPVKGVFMETIEGTDINRLKEDDPILNADASLSENPEVLAQITDLQVFDFICCNVDRHMGNMIYDIGKNDNGKVVLKGIKGIDNDCAFGIPDVSSNVKVKQMVKPEKMQFIRESMVKKLKDIKSKSTLRYRLSGNGLTNEEIDAAWERLVMVRKAAKKGVITMVPDDYWKSNLLLNTKTIPGNYLSRMKSLASTAKNTFKETKEVKDIHYVEDSTYKRVMFEKADEIAKFRKQMNKAKALLFNSSEYNLMEKSFKKIEELSKQVKDCGSPENISDELAQNVKQAYAALADKTNKYVQLKSLIPSTVRGQKRIEFALGLLGFAGETLKEMVPGKERMDEVQREEPPKDMDMEENQSEMEDLDGFEIS